MRRVLYEGLPIAAPARSVSSNRSFWTLLESRLLFCLLLRLELKLGRRKDAGFGCGLRVGDSGDEVAIVTEMGLSLSGVAGI